MHTCIQETYTLPGPGRPRDRAQPQHRLDLPEVGGGYYRTSSDIITYKLIKSWSSCIMLYYQISFYIILYSTRLFPTPSNLQFWSISMSVVFVVFAVYVVFVLLWPDNHFTDSECYFKLCVSQRHAVVNHKHMRCKERCVHHHRPKPSQFPTQTEGVGLGLECFLPTAYTVLCAEVTTICFPPFPSKVLTIAEEAHSCRWCGRQKGHPPKCGRWFAR